MDKSTHKFQDRSRAREIALEYLYQWFVLEKKVCDTPGEFIYFKENISHKGREFAQKIIAGTIENIHEIEKIISETARNWSIDRMITIDRVILCIGTFEIIFLKDIPGRVSINEAIELAKKYSSVKSFAFVNGILDKISKRMPKKDVASETKNDVNSNSEQNLIQNTKINTNVEDVSPEN